MRKLTMIALVGALVWTALPAQAGDEDKDRVAVLEAEAARVTADLTHLRQAYDQVTANAARAQRAVEVLTDSLNAMRELNAALQRDMAALRADIKKRPDDDPARLRLALREERMSNAKVVAAANDRANLNATRATKAESDLARAEEQHAREATDMREKLRKAEEALKALRGG